MRLSFPCENDEAAEAGVVVGGGSSRSDLSCRSGELVLDVSAREGCAADEEEKV